MQSAKFIEFVEFIEFMETGAPFGKLRAGSDRLRANGKEFVECMEFVGFVEFGFATARKS